MKQINKLAVIILILITIFSLSSCYSKIDNNKGFDLIRDALVNSYKEGVYFIKSTYIFENGDIKNDNTYVMSDLDKKGYPLKDENGNYKNLKAKTENKFYDNNKKKSNDVYYICGTSKSIDKSASRDYVFKTFKEPNASDKEKAKTIKQPMDVYTFKNTSYFKNMDLDFYLAEVSTWTKDDMNFDVKNGGIKKQGNTTEIIFTLSDEYCNRFYETYGKDTVYKGKYISFEIAYDRVSNINVFKEDTSVSFMAFDYEVYKLNIVYMSPKFDVYNFDKTESDKSLSYPDGIFIL